MKAENIVEEECCRPHEIIFQKPIENDEETISLRDISTGTYIVRVMNGDRVLSKWVVKVE